MSEANEILTIDIVSDVVCPWCYLGEKRLEAALAEEHRPVAVRWRPYQLDPTIPAGGLDRAEYMEKKFGKSGRLQSVHDNLTRLGAEVGLPFAFDRIKRSPNTLDAHRLIRWAASAGVQEQSRRSTVQGLFRRGTRHRRPRPCSSKSPRECGLDPTLVEKLLADGADVDLVRQEIEQAQAMGVSGVPFFIFAGRIGVPGAQEPSVLRQAMAEARQAMAESAGEAPVASDLISRGVVEGGDKLGLQFDARRFILAEFGARRGELERRRRILPEASRSPRSTSAQARRRRR